MNKSDYLITFLVMNKFLGWVFIWITGKFSINALLTFETLDNFTISCKQSDFWY